ncbi:MAG: hypothetical protein HY513_01850 [Candidatus Aenigmarchaeota archaeon]|nr:hypothetical protein [Candidatus Aenigmarchaeota archaeon]
MTSIEAHKESIKYMLEDVNEKIRKEQATTRQKLVGFACSEASCDMLAVLLHLKNLIDPGFNVNHRFFASEKIAKSRLKFDFPSKNALMPLLVQQEEYRNSLCYGKPKESKTVDKCVENLFTIKKIIEKELGEDL